MSLSRWQPFREMMTLRDAMDRLFDDPFLRQPLASLTSASALPMDIVERENELVVRASVPGFDPEQIDISIQGDLLTLRGSTQEESGNQNESYHLREYRAQNFQRTVRLPMNVNADEATAECRNGVLTIHLPKAADSGVKRISVNQGQSRLESGNQIEVNAQGQGSRQGQEGSQQDQGQGGQGSQQGEPS